MAFVAWIVLGLAAGLIGGRLVSRAGEGILPDVLLGVVGAMAGGWLYYTFGPPSLTGFNLASQLVAVSPARWFFCLFITL